MHKYILFNLLLSSIFRKLAYTIILFGSVCEVLSWPKPREQDNSPTRQLTDTIFETIQRQILRQLTDTLRDNSPTLVFKVFLSFFRYCTTPSRGLRAGGLRLKATVQKVYGKRKDKDDRVKKNIQEELKGGKKKVN